MNDFFRKIGNTISSVFNSVMNIITKPFSSAVSSVAKPLSGYIISLAILGIVLILLLGAVKKTKIGGQFL